VGKTRRRTVGRLKQQYSWNRENWVDVAPEYEPPAPEGPKVTAHTPPSWGDFYHAIFQDFHKVEDELPAMEIGEAIDRLARVGAKAACELTVQVPVNQGVPKELAQNVAREMEQEDKLQSPADKLGHGKDILRVLW
jgi:hypothetical protein